MINRKNLESSFRDPSGFVFWENGRLFRQINPIYKDNFDLLKSSGLLKKLQDEGLLVKHKEVSLNVLEPELVPFISYPYEWCFSELKDAALLTLKIQKIALEHGMSLKDATSFNVQFLRGKPVFIDTLSFEPARGGPWVAYKQFCEQFLAPLALISYQDARLNELLIPFINGIPLDLAAKLLPTKARLNMGILMHIILHAGSQKKFADSKKGARGQGLGVSKNSILGIVDSLTSTVSKLEWKFGKTAWSNYGDEDYFESYSKDTLEKKRKIVADLLALAKPKTVWDLGANTGNYSRIAAQKGIFTVSLDFDHAAVEQNYKRGDENILPLYLDLANPTPAIGFDNTEREALLRRPAPDLVMALALVHHLAIGNNLPLPKLAAFFSKIANNLIIEFVPKDDPQTQRLLISREDVFPDYTQEEFEKAFGEFYKTTKKVPLPNSKRTLYLFKQQ